jgi:hypothetical protein
MDVDSEARVEQARAESSRGLRRVDLLLRIVAALVIAFVFVPMFYYPLGERSYCAFPGVSIAVVAAAVSSHAFCACPRKPWWSKLFVLMLAAPTLSIATDCVMRYAFFGFER